MPKCYARSVHRVSRSGELQRKPWSKDLVNDRIVAEVVVECLKRHGVEVMFSQSLPSAALLAAEDAGIRTFTYRQENSGGAMADGYARISHKVGIVTAQNGPAATLLVAPLAEALKSSVPVIALVQEVERANLDRNAFQELDHIALSGGCTKWIRRVTEVSRVEDYIDMAFAAATGGRPGPVVLRRSRCSTKSSRAYARNGTPLKTSFRPHRNGDATYFRRSGR